MIVPSLRQVGPVNVAYDLCTLLIGLGHEVSVKYFDEFDSGTHAFPCYTEKIELNKPFYFDEFDIIHTHGLRPTRYGKFFKSEMSKAKLVTTAHNYVFQDFKYKYGTLKSLVGGFMFIRAANKHDAIITLSYDAKKYYTKWLNRDKLHVIYNSIIPSHVDADKRLVAELLDLKGKNNIIIGTNCSLIKRKGIDLLIKALPNLPENIKLVLIGDGDEKQKLISLSETLGVRDRVNFFGFQKNASIYLNYYDILVLPSRSEGFPLGILEAASIGKKVVCSDLPTLKEVFSPEEVEFFTMDDPASLAAAIMNVLKNSEIGCNLKKAYETRYSPGKFVNDHLDLYNKLLND